MKVYNDREIVRILRKNGFVQLRSNGTSHVVWMHEVTKRKLSLNAKNVNRMVWQRLVKEYNIQCEF